MKYWFLEDQSRLLKEKEEIENLYSITEWLVEIEWFLESELILKAKIKAHGHIYEVELKYHAYFPSTPPTVTPLDKEIDWSEHQYTSGTLCLEWGPDNWYPTITGAQMLESTYKLIYSENPYGKKQDGTIPSRHLLSQGQELRNQFIRYYVDQELFKHLSNLQQNKVFNINYTLQFEGEAAILHVLEIKDPEVICWTNNHYPNHLKPKNPKNGIVVNTKLTKERIKALKDITELERLFEWKWDKELSKIKFVILIDNDGDIHALFGYSDDKKVFTVPIVFDKNDGKRLPNTLENLKTKKIGIVGLGSLGSKVSDSLARMGVRDFYLVDDDLFMRGNIERHTLDWTSIGTHKVNSVKSRLLKISSQMKVQVANINISGQEATSALNSVLLSLSKCDLILDATANPKAFNYLSAVSTTNNIPMVWGEIFAGGIGGLIARSRPGLDPDPLTMRALFNGYTQKSPYFKYHNNNEPYVAEIDEAQVMIASDADVSVVASHTTRFIADSLVENVNSIFPHSMYLIGMSNSWIFEEPFDTRPIETSNYIEKRNSKSQTEESEKAKDFIKSLLENMK